MATDSPVRELAIYPADPEAHLLPWPQAEKFAALAKEVATKIADMADADQWAITLRGVEGTGPADFEELVPRRWLQLLNGGKEAAYRLTLVLHSDSQDLGILRLATLRPCGFSQEDVARARLAAEAAAEMLSSALHPCEEPILALAS
jgi:hypothetical protein